MRGRVEGRLERDLGRVLVEIGFGGFERGLWRVIGFMTVWVSGDVGRWSLVLRVGYCEHCSRRFFILHEDRKLGR